MTDPHRQHISDRLRKHLRTIVDWWDDLHDDLARGGGIDRTGVRTIPASRVLIDTTVSDLIAEIDSWARFLARILVDEIDWTPPTPTTTKRILDDIALARVGHFSSHPDEHLAAAVMDDAARLARTVMRTLDPNRRRRIRLGVPCLEHTTTDLGQRVPCDGEYETWLYPDELLRDMVCSRDPAHRMTPLEWQRSQRKGLIDRDAGVELLRAITHKHTSATMPA